MRPRPCQRERPPAIRGAPTILAAPVSYRVPLRPNPTIRCDSRQCVARRRANPLKTLPALACSNRPVKPHQRRACPRRHLQPEHVPSIRTDPPCQPRALPIQADPSRTDRPSRLSTSLPPSRRHLAPSLLNTAPCPRRHPYPGLLRPDRFAPTSLFVPSRAVPGRALPDVPRHCLSRQAAATRQVYPSRLKPPLAD